MKKIVFIFIAVLSFSQIFGAGNNEDVVDEAGVITVFTSILPQKYFVNRIAGDRVNVEVMVLPGKNPATYDPSPRQIQALGKAAAFFTIGVPFEQGFLPSIRSDLANLRIVATDAGIQKRMLEAHSHEDEDEDEHDHEAEDEDEHDPESPDPHVWMDPILVEQQAKIILDTLVEIDPEGADDYRNGYSLFISDLEKVNQELETLLKPCQGQALFVYHPAFGYFADRYGLKQVAIETGGKEPSPAQLEEVIHHAVEEGVKIIFVQPEFPVKSAQAVATAIGGAVVPVAPLKEEYVENLQNLGKAIAEGLSR